MTSNPFSLNKASMARRSGTSLLEMMVIISMMAVILPSVTVALAGIAKTVRNQRRAEEAGRIAERLVQQVRSDAHRSQGPIDVAADKMVCRLPGEIEVTYTLPGETAAVAGIERIERSGPRILSRQSFQLAAGERASFSIYGTDELLNAPAVIELRFENEVKSRGWRVIAAAPQTESRHE